MKATEILNEIKNVLGIELSEESVALAVMKLENGTEIEAESFEVGKDVFIKNEDGDSIPLPVGDYTLEDGTLLSVKEEGKIAEMKKKEEESSEPKEDLEEEKEDEEKMNKYATKEELSKVVAEFKAMYEQMMDSIGKEEASDAPAELSSDKVELSEESEEISHSPEAEVDSKPMNLYSQNRPMTTQQRVFNKLFNN